MYEAEKRTHGNAVCPSCEQQKLCPSSSSTRPSPELAGGLPSLQTHTLASLLGPRHHLLHAPLEPEGIYQQELGHPVFGDLVRTWLAFKVTR